MPSSQTKNYDVALPLASNSGNLSRTGYSFAGWNTAADGTGTAYATGASYTANADVILYAKWTPDTYSVSFAANGATSGAVPSNQTKSHDVALTLANNSGNLSRIGYSFTGWNTAADGSGAAYAAGESYTTNAAVTLYAQWTANSYTLNFDAAGGSEVAPITASFGSAISAPANPSREGYTFAGWSPAIPATMPAANTTLTALWTVNRYTLNFDAAGGSAVTPISADFGAVITAPANPRREGYVFMGWLPAVPATMPAQNLTLTAQYEQIQLTVSATVTGAASITPVTQQVNYGSTATLELSLTHPNDIVVLSGSCQAAVSGNQIVTSVITEACSVVVTVYPFTTVEKDTQTALASNTFSRFSFNSGAGEKSLTEATVRRAGVESELELEDAEALITQQTDGSYLFRAKRTGRYQLNFMDTVSGERVQVMYDVLPYLAFTSVQQPVQLNVATTVRLWLSDEPVDYPVTAAVVK